MSCFAWFCPYIVCSFSQVNEIFIYHHSLILQNTLFSSGILLIMYPPFIFHKAIIIVSNLRFFYSMWQVRMHMTHMALFFPFNFGFFWQHVYKNKTVCVCVTYYLKWRNENKRSWIIKQIHHSVFARRHVLWYLFNATLHNWNCISF